MRTFFSTNPGREAIVFVHGYGGDPISTWSDFERLLPISPAVSSYDLMFYGYDALHSELVASSHVFYQFMQWLFNAPVKQINASLPSGAEREKGFAYDRVLLVAHSLGAVIARWALLEATKAKNPWANKTGLVLFAPAHSGANVIGLVLEATSYFRFVALFAALARFKSPVIDQLKPDSPELKWLRSETEAALREDEHNHLIARKVCIAEYERVVKNLPFFPG